VSCTEYVIVVGIASRAYRALIFHLTISIDQACRQEQTNA
jgi:hypothetical protein